MKKVDEGVTLFDEIWEKVYSAEQQNQKEKYEGDLKKEIKKLQRLRDQIKSWIGSSDVKDKDALVEYRKLIETKMEQFKICEKETKTKTYSKEGLARQEKLTPEEQAKVDCCKWVAEFVEKLQEAVEVKDLEVETLSSGKGKKTNKGKIEDCKTILANHQSHVSKLEGIQRLVMNDTIPVENVEAIKEDLEYYLEAGEEEDYLISYDEEYFYEPVGLEDLDVVNVDHVTAANTDSSSKGKKSKEDDASTTTSGSKKKDKTTKKAASGMIPLTIGRARNASAGEKEKKTPQKVNRQASSASSTGSGALGPTPQTRTTPAAQPSGASMAAILKRESEQQEKERQKTLAAQQQQQRLLQEQQAKQQAELLRQQQMQKQQELEVQQQQAELFKRQQAEQQQREQHEAAAAAAQQQQLLQQQAAQLQAQQQAASGGGAALGGLLGSGSGLGGLPLGGGADVSGATASTIGSGQPGGAAIGGGGADATGRYLGGLQDSFLNMPGANETERQRTYQPKNPYSTPSSYPTVPAATFDNPAFYEKAGIDCLFFIFYYSQGTYQQYLAAKELKKQSWRFHKKYSTWFQRHEEPKITTDEYEEGTYVYFDFETGWSQRIKSDFRFEYSFLEDSLQ